MTDSTLQATCGECGQEIVGEEYDKRHSYHRLSCNWADYENADVNNYYCDCGGEDAHDVCCPDCNERPIEHSYHRRECSFYPTPYAQRQIPKLYDTEAVPVADKLIVAHYYLGACHWWLAEYDPDERRGFGYVCLGDPANAEWGYISLDELEQLRLFGGDIVWPDLHWRPTRAADADLPGRWC